MTTHNANNERIKRKYFTYLKEAMRHSEPTIDEVAKALARFERYTRYKDFKTFHYDQAVAFKRHLADQKAKRSGESLSKATLHSTLTQLKRFFQWLSREPGYKTHIKYTDADYFNLSDKDTRIATAKRDQKVPTLEQIKHVINTMPAGTDIERRNRALIAFTAITGARDSAIASMRLKHIDLHVGCVYQDAREVRTKFSKTFTTYFLPAAVVGEEICRIVEEWVKHLREVKLWSNDDPLFPATRIAVGDSGRFEAVGLERAHWSSASPIRAIFKEAFIKAGLPYFNPHTFRNMLVRIGQGVCKTPEDFKAWSQNFGHEQVLTTFFSYGHVESRRQGEIIRGLATPQQSSSSGADEIAEAVFKMFRNRGLKIEPEEPQ